MVDEVPVEDCLEEASYEGYPNDVLPVIDPEWLIEYQCRM